MEKKLIPVAEQEISFSDKPVTFGRSAEADVQIDDASVSNIHCAVRLWDDLLIIKDMGSTNGIKVNDKRIDRVAVINPGDKVQIGNIIFEV
ncbi:MAG: FHA domain-containing protein [Verrucomicrobiae bacterium]|nr:FHA domain-containing protein [Verrucomicrobiae bacterium]